MTDGLTFFVAGHAETAGSKSIVPIQKGGQTVARRVVESGNRSAKAAWRADVREAAERALIGAAMVGGEVQPELLAEWPTADALAVTFVFCRLRPKGHFGTGKNAGTVKASAPPFPTTRPDALKLARAAEDALSGVLWTDDSIIVAEHLYKRWAEREGLQVTVRRLDAAGMTSV